MSALNYILSQHHADERDRVFRFRGTEWRPRLVTKVYEFRDSSGRAVRRARQAGLLDQVQSSDLTRGLLVAWQTRPPDAAAPAREPPADAGGGALKKEQLKVCPAEGIGAFRDKKARAPKMLFSFFALFLDFADFQEEIADEERAFFEIILGPRRQKPHFDIDVGLEDLADVNAHFAGAGAPAFATVAELGQALLEAVIRGCCEVCAAAEPPLALELARDFAVYTSSGPAKASFHLVIPTYAHDDNREAREFARRVAASPAMGPFRDYPRLFKVVDQSVYSSKQQFRILGSSKIGAGRHKRLVNPFRFGGRDVQHAAPPADSEAHARVIELGESLVSFAADCRPLPKFAPQAAPRREIAAAGLLSEEQIAKALELNARVNGGNFEVGRVSGTAIFLRRLAPSFCALCKRTHMSENPILFVRQAGPGLFAAAWSCQRAGKGAHLPLGTFVAQGAPLPAPDGAPDAGGRPRRGGTCFFEVPHAAFEAAEEGEDVVYVTANELRGAAPPAAAPPPVRIRSPLDAARDVQAALAAAPQKRGKPPRPPVTTALIEAHVPARDELEYALPAPSRFEAKVEKVVPAKAPNLAH